MTMPRVDMFIRTREDVMRRITEVGEELADGRWRVTIADVTTGPRSLIIQWKPACDRFDEVE